MIKKLALSLTALLASATPAIASPHTAIRNSDLTRVLERTGVTVLTSHPECHSDPSYGFYSPGRRIVVICVGQHYEYGKMDYAELGDTLRHEAIHVAQVCNGGGEEAVPILSWSTISKYSTPGILRAVMQYPAEVQHIEYEAFTSARNLSNDQVAGIVTDYCF